MADRLQSELQRDCSQDGCQDEKEQVIKIILHEIDLATKRREKPDKSFICYEDLKRIWSDKSRISILLQPDRLSQNEIHFIQENMIIILSTLISVGAGGCLTNFRARLFDPKSGDALLTDVGIPYERNQLIFLNSEPALQQLFYEHQFKFKPVVIQLESGQRTQVIKDRKMRLPFERIQKDVGAGGYGKVDCVDISPRYIKEESGASWESVYEVACKKIVFRKDFSQEVDNLQILKESLTHHDRIMLHLATIEHGPKHYILLPYANYGDLEQFLRCGVGPVGKPKYDFDQRFKEVGNSDCTHQLLRQCWSLANALVWLHTGITIEKTSSTVFCVHMDLKPANILIKSDPESVVGKWMISDFGISVLTEETKRQDSEYVSIGDYYSQLTVNTRPKRREGTYQAPEVKLSENFYEQLSNLTPDQKGIGRRSDIWSYGCIFSEVLAFALGRDKLVIEFQAARKRKGMDYFFVEKADHGHLLVPDNIPKQCEVYPPILKWLDGLCDKATTGQRWVDCYVETIKKILIVDTAIRPDATDLLKLVNHVKEHVATPRGSTPVDCPLLQANDEAAVATSAVSISQRGSSSLTSTTSISSSDLNMERNPAMGSIESRSTGSDRSGGRRSTIEHNDEFEGNLPIPRHGPYAEYNVPLPDLRKDSRIDPSMFAPYRKPTQAHGIMIDPDVRRTPEPSVRIDLPRPESSNSKATYVSLVHSSGGIHAAYLARSSVYIYKLNIQDLSATFELEVKLPHSDGWKGVALTGYFLAAWGFSSTKMLYLCDIRQPQKQINLPSASELRMLERVAVSEQGVAALLCAQRILVVNIHTQTSIISLSAHSEQKFTDVAFNDTGDLLFAWAFGQTDSFYSWKCQDCIVNDSTRSETHYKTDKKGKPYLTRVIPYTTLQSAIIATPDKRFFPSASPFSPPFSFPPQQRPQGIMNAHVRAACVFQDHSLVTIEKEASLFHRPARVKEYGIEYKSAEHVLGVGGVAGGGPLEVCRLETGTEEGVRFVVVECVCGEEGSSGVAAAAAAVIVVVVCNLNETVEFIRIVGAAA